jgi:hypothetical protein
MSNTPEAWLQGMFTGQRLKDCVLLHWDRVDLNTSPIDLAKLGSSGIKDKLNSYIHSFSKDIKSDGKRISILTK